MKKIILPQGAVDACIGKSDGDSCEFKVNENNLNGTCRSGRTGELMCFSLGIDQRPINHTNQGGNLK